MSIQLKAGWLKRQFNNVAVEVACLPKSYRDAMQHDDATLTAEQRKEAAGILRSRASLDPVNSDPHIYNPANTPGPSGWRIRTFCGVCIDHSVAMKALMDHCPSIAVSPNDAERSRCDVCLNLWRAAGRPRYEHGVTATGAQGEIDRYLVATALTS